MSALLQQLADDVGASERTIRRAVSAGTIHAERPSPQTLHLTTSERRYVRTHWSVLGGIRSALRTEPNVEAAVLFGSVARGEDTPDSDVDVLVWLHRSDRTSRRALRERLEDSVGRPVQIVEASDALKRAAFVEAILRDGRVLVDRSARWRSLRAGEPAIRKRAAAERRAAAQRTREAEAYFERRVRLARDT